MVYKGYFKDIYMTEYEVDIYTTDGGYSEFEITLADEPVIIKTNSEGLFAPIKAQSCTINIVTDGGLFDLYAINPQEVKVHVHTRGEDPVTIFRGYATPMQYGQDWTTLDTLTLECVDLISSLKARPYEAFNGSVKSYLPTDTLISALISRVEDPNDDQLYHVLKWYWPKKNFRGTNTYELNTTHDFLHAIKFNEANFFDDDDEKTPWTCYEVLEEICRFYNVSLVTYQGSFYFIDYLYVATDEFQNYDFWEYTLDGDIESKSKTKNTTLNNTEYSGGTSSIEMKELYNYVSVNANRYDIEEICSDIMNHKEYHISITKERNFGSGLQVWTHTKEGWFTHQETYKYVYKTFCRINSAKSLWTHHWYRPKQTTISGTTYNLYEVGNYYDGETYDLEMQNPSTLGFYNLPENQWINTIGATFLHYATLDSLANKPTKLDWNDVVVFQTSHATINTQGGNNNFMRYKFSDIYDETLEKVALTYNSDYELNFSPKEGTSWIVFNAKLWYQHNESAGDPEIYPTNLNKDNLRQVMFPIEDVTDREPFYERLTNSPKVLRAAKRACYLYYPQYTDQGWDLLKIRLRIGDKYWNGTQWTPTDSTFYLRFTNTEEDDGLPRWKIGNDAWHRDYDEMTCLKWLDCVSNTDYEDKVGAEGYAIPIQKVDGVCGQVHIDIFMPKMLPNNFSDMLQLDLTDDTPSWSQAVYDDWKDVQIPWYNLAPIVFMKDFEVKYVYTDESEWYLNEEINTDDVKYINETKDAYKYEKQLTSKINSWQDQRPIAKSFPIVNYTQHQDAGHPYPFTACEYVNTIVDEFNYNVNQKQEYNIIDRQLRHYLYPEKTFKCHRKFWMTPWMKVTLNDALELDGYYVVDNQEWDVRNRNVTVELVQFGDAEYRH